MAAAKPKPKAKAKVVEVILPTSRAMKHVVKFETDEQGVAVNNIYIGLDGMRQLGNPDAVKITIEAHNDDS